MCPQMAGLCHQMYMLARLFAVEPPGLPVGYCTLERHDAEVQCGARFFFYVSIAPSRALRGHKVTRKSQLCVTLTLEK